MKVDRINIVGLLTLSLTLVLFSQPVTQVPLSKPLLASVAKTRTRYRTHLEAERKNKEAKEQAVKRKEAEECLQELRVKRRCIQEVSDGLLGMQTG